MNGLAARTLPYLLAFFSSFCIMILELVASRLVARHVGASLTVWTSVIGIMLGGICLGNVLGGRLADRVEPGRAVGPLYALAAALTLGCLWMNVALGFVPGLGAMPWNVGTVLVVTLDFLVPASVLGMIGPVVAKMAVEQARRAGSAIGDIYFFGAVGSIVGTFFAGFVLMYLAPTSAIVTLVAAALSVLAALMIGGREAMVLGLLAAACLGAGTAAPVTHALPMPRVSVGSFTVHPVALVGHALTLALSALGLARLRAARAASADLDASAVGTTERAGPDDAAPVSLTDLAILSFLASLTFMALEMVAGRLVTRHLGSSIYGWTSIIGVLLGGLSLGNFLGGKIADLIRNEKQASWLFLAASVLTLFVLMLESPPRFLDGAYFSHKKSVLSYAITWTKIPLPGGAALPLTWPSRVLLVVMALFFLPSLAMGTVSPVVAKLAIDRVRRSKRTGRAIGQVYAWGMVGSILGTFLTGFVLIDLLGTKGMLLALATVLGFSATALGSVWHAAWAGIPLGLCVIAFSPVRYLETQGDRLGIREETGNPSTTEEDHAWVDESNYYFIKVENEPDPDGQKRTLVLDNLIHGYFVLGHPERLDYDYEHIYGLVAHRVAEAKARASGRSNSSQAPLKTLFLGGGAYTFQRYMQFQYPETAVDVAEIDPAVTRANLKATGLPADTTIHTEWGDARQFVIRHQKDRQYDLVFGDAFNDFSVPWHLTTREFNDKLGGMMAPDGVYMINIIDAYESDARAETRADRQIRKENAAREQRHEAPTGEAAREAIRRKERARARRFGGFLASWVRTARLTFPHIYVFGTDETPGSGLRETFVVVASKQPLKLDDLGSRDDDPKFFASDRLFEPRPFPESDLKQIDRRARGVYLTDDYAPVENLLAPVAETRGEDD